MRQSTAATTSIAAIALLGSIQPGWAAPAFDGQTVFGTGVGDQEPPSHPIPEKPDNKMFNPLHRTSHACSYLSHVQLGADPFSFGWNDI